MTIEKLDKEKILISLCSQDMKDYSLSFDSMNLDNDHSRKVILRLLRLACNKTGIDYLAKSVIVEALPCEGGCLILMTVINKQKTRHKYRVKRLSEKPCFVFENAENLLGAMEKLKGVSLVHPNSLWLCEGSYRLVFDYPLVPDSVERVLWEYSRRQSLSAVQVSRLCEQGRLLCEKNAVGIISRSFH